MDNYKKIDLKNGARVILVPEKSTQVLTAVAMFNVGSRNESDSNAGISHVLEHMHFKGTNKRPTAFLISEFVDSMGAEHNAFTGKEYTGYYIKATPKHLGEAIDYLSDILTNSIFDETELNREKNVIIQEINMYEDLPMEAVSWRFEQALFGKNALGRDVIGTKESVNSISKQDLVDYRNKHYIAENTVIVLAGNFGQHSEEDLINLIKKSFNFEAPSKEKTEQIELNSEKAKSIVKKETEQSHLIIGFRTESIAGPDYYKLDLLALILGGSMSSRMFEEIREKRGLAYSVRTSSNNYLESGLIETQAGVPHEKIYETIEAIMGEYKKVMNEEILESELNKAKEIINGRILIKFEDSEEIAMHYAFDEILLHKILTPSEELKEYQKVTTSDILEVAKKYFQEDRLALSYVGPGLDEEKLKNIFKL